jgi:hypothetical protein
LNDDKENSNNTTTTDNRSKKKVDDDDEWSPDDSDNEERFGDEDLSEDEYSVDISIDNSDQLKMEELSTQSNEDDVLSDSDSSLSARGEELDAYIKDNCANDGGVPAVITIADCPLTWRARAKSVVTSAAKKMVPIVRTIVSMPLQMRLFTDKEEVDDDNQSIDSFNHYVQTNCVDTGLEGMSLSEMRNQPAILSPEEQRGHDMGFIVALTGQPLRVTNRKYTGSDYRFNFVYSTSERGEYTTYSTVEAAKFCGVERINLPHPQEAKELVEKLGFSLAEYAAAYVIENKERKYYDLYNYLGERKRTNIRLDIFETGDDSETVLAMSSKLQSLRSITGKDILVATDVFRQFFNNNKSEEYDALLEVKVDRFTFKVHDWRKKTFEEGVVHGMEQKVDSLKGIGRITQAEKCSGGRFVVCQTTPVNKPHWQRDGERIVAHALSMTVVLRLIKKGTKTVYPELNKLKQKPPGTAWKCSNNEKESFEVYVYDEKLHGDWTCYVSREKAAEGGSGNKKKGSQKKRKRSN